MTYLTIVLAVSTFCLGGVIVALTKRLEKARSLVDHKQMLYSALLDRNKKLAYEKGALVKELEALKSSPPKEDDGTEEALEALKGDVEAMEELLNEAISYEPRYRSLAKRYAEISQQRDYLFNELETMRKAK